MVGESTRTAEVTVRCRWFSRDWGCKDWCNFLTGLRSSTQLRHLFLCGQRNGQVSLLRRLWDVLQRGDVLLADSLMCKLAQYLRGVGAWRAYRDANQQSSTQSGFSKRKRLGKDDHIVQWPEPKMRGVRGQAYKALPEYVKVREVRIQVEQAGLRSKEIVIVTITTLLDSAEFPKQDLAELFRARWNQELDLRSIKVTMQVDFLRCKTPELVRKEAWTHLLAYNLIRSVMAQAADKHDVVPRTLSLKASVQTFEAFQPFMVAAGSSHQLRAELYQQLLNTIVIHRAAKIVLTVSSPEGRSDGECHMTYFRNQEPKPNSIS